MKAKQMYHAWKEGKSKIRIRDNFTEAVMNQICQYEQNKRKSFFDMQWLVDLISTHPLAQAGLIATGAVTGLVRLIFMILVILSKGDING